jgi:hypothetical protein
MDFGSQQSFLKEGKNEGKNKHAKKKKFSLKKVENAPNFLQAQTKMIIMRTIWKEDTMLMWRHLFLLLSHLNTLSKEDYDYNFLTKRTSEVLVTLLDSLYNKDKTFQKLKDSPLEKQHVDFLFQFIAHVYPFVEEISQNIFSGMLYFQKKFFFFQ